MIPNKERGRRASGGAPAGGSGRPPSRLTDYKPLDAKAQSEGDTYCGWWLGRWELWTREQRRQFLKRAERGWWPAEMWARREHRRYGEQVAKNGF